MGALLSDLLAGSASNFIGLISFSTLKESVFLSTGAERNGEPAGHQTRDGGGGF